MNVLETIKAKIPKRFKRGAGVVGPDYHGCCNTGMQPVITRSPYEQVEKPLFMVGPKLYISQYQYQIALDFLTKKIQSRYGSGKQTVFVFLDRNSAIKKFLELCQQILEYNQSEIDTIRKLKERANQGDMAAVWELQDH